MAASDGAGDGGEGAVRVSIPEKSVFGDIDHVRDAVPFSQQSATGPKAGPGLRCLFFLSVFSCQFFQSGLWEPAMTLHLDLIRQYTAHKDLTHTWWWRFVVECPPSLRQIFAAEST